MVKMIQNQYKDIIKLQKCMKSVDILSSDDIVDAIIVKNPECIGGKTSSSMKSKLKQTVSARTSPY